MIVECILIFYISIKYVIVLPSLNSRCRVKYCLCSQKHPCTENFVFPDLPHLLPPHTPPDLLVPAERDKGTVVEDPGATGTCSQTKGARWP